MPGPKAKTAPLDLSALPTDDRAARCIAFIEQYCRIHNGKRAGELIVLRDWQKDIIREVIRPGIRRAYLQMPRKNGKTALAACIALYFLLGDGENGAEVYSVANKLAQAVISWAIARRMVELDPSLRQAVQVFGGRGAYMASKLYDPTTDSSFVPLPSTGDADNLHGTNPSFVLFDEVHGQDTDAIWEAVSLGMGARDTPLLLGASTPGNNESSLAHDLYEYGKAGKDSTFAFKAFEAPVDCDWTSEDSWYQANPALGDFLRIDDMRSAAESTPEHAFRRFRLGQWVSGGDAWISMAAWDRLVGEVEFGPDEPVRLGFDGSVSEDSTALMVCSVEGPPWRLGVVRLWERLGVRDYRVPRDDVIQTVDEYVRSHNVKQIICDPPYWSQEIAMWGAMYGGRRVISFPTYMRSRMVPAATAFRQAVLDGKIVHNGDKVLRNHVSNAIGIKTPQGEYPAKHSNNSPAHIDALIAGIICWWPTAQGHRSKPRILGGEDAGA